MATIKKSKAAMKGVKKAQNGDSTKPRKVITEKNLYEKFIPSYREMMTGVGNRKQAPDSTIEKYIKKGYFRRDPQSLDLFPTEKYRKAGNKIPKEDLKKGGKVVAKKSVIKKAVVKKSVKKSVKKK